MIVEQFRMSVEQLREFGGRTWNELSIPYYMGKVKPFPSFPRRALDYSRSSQRD